MFEINDSAYLFGIDITPFDLRIQVMRGSAGSLPTTSQAISINTLPIKPLSFFDATVAEKVLAETHLASQYPANDSEEFFRVSEDYSGSRFIEFPLSALQTSKIPGFLKKLTTIGVDNAGHATVISDQNRSIVTPLLGADELGKILDHYNLKEPEKLAAPPPPKIKGPAHTTILDLNATEYRALPSK